MALCNSSLARGIWWLATLHLATPSAGITFPDAAYPLFEPADRVKLVLGPNGVAVPEAAFAQGNAGPPASAGVFAQRPPAEVLSRPPLVSGGQADSDLLASLEARDPKLELTATRARLRVAASELKKGTKELDSLLGLPSPKISWSPQVAKAAAWHPPWERWQAPWRRFAPLSPVGKNRFLGHLLMRNRPVAPATAALDIGMLREPKKHEPEITDFEVRDHVGDPIFSQFYFWCCSIGVFLALWCCISPLCQPDNIIFNLAMDMVIVVNVAFTLADFFVADPLFYYVENVCMTIFLGELVLRYTTLHRHFWSGWNVFDAFLVICGILDTWVIPFAVYYHFWPWLTENGGWLYIVTILRIFRLLRLVRLLRPDSAIHATRVGKPHFDMNTEVWFSERPPDDLDLDMDHVHKGRRGRHGRPPPQGP